MDEEQLRSRQSITGEVEKLDDKVEAEIKINEPSKPEIWIRIHPLTINCLQKNGSSLYKFDEQRKVVYNGSILSQFNIISYGCKLIQTLIYVLNTDASNLNSFRR